MANQTLDCKGLACPQPILKVQAAVIKMQPKDTLDVYADCKSFPDDIKNWCTRTKKVLVFCADKGGWFHSQVVV